MIEILGSDVGSERLAAEELKALFELAWPDIVSSRLLNVDIFAGAKLYGQRIQDIDLLVLVDFEDAPKAVSFRGDRITLGSACIAIETKDHDPRGVRFEWNKVYVHYDDGWSDVTEKGFRQMHSLRAYLRESGVEKARVQDLIWLRGVPTADLPSGPHNIIGADATAESIVVQLSAASGDRRLMISDTPGNRIASNIRRIMSRRLTPSVCDRKRLERVLAENPIDARIGEAGRHEIILRGHGGTGKTMTLLRAAWELFQSRGRRVLILTYNRALRSDILRQLVFMRIDIGINIDVQTVHSFLRPLLVELSLLPDGIMESDKEFFERFEAAKSEAIPYLRDAASEQDIAEFKSRLPNNYNWDIICVDEGQDWPLNERDLLAALYRFENIIVADGIDQLIRDVKPCNWHADLEREQFEVVEMSRCLRLKSNLGRFISVIAQELDQPSWRIDVAGSIPGGRVVVIDGDYFVQRPLHEALMKQNAADGNANIDMLFCVPPDNVLGEASSRLSIAGRRLENWGYDVWDGASPLVRDGFPVSIEQFRVVQYESCRGLEGWTVVCCDLDRFYDLKFDSCVYTGAMSTEVDERARFAFRWLMIPLTRAISTLVIVLRQRESKIRTALLAARKLLPEVVEWHSLG